MASSSSKALIPSSSASSSQSVMYSGKWEYDVFLCFRGADTRHGFTSHLMAALSDNHIKAFIDDMLDKTESIGELISVLRRSALSIVIFSENFADSSWCLDEVATIFQSMEQSGHRVLPVFYKVDPSDVADDSGSYSATIELEHGARSIPEDRKRWMDALKAVANCAGHTSEAIKIDSELVDVIVKDVLKRLVSMSSRVKSEILIGMDVRVSEVEKLLAMEMNDFRIIGLWGMGGVGKTILAKALYQSLISSTKGIKHQFVRNIHQTCEMQNGMVRIVEYLYSTLLSEDNLSCEDLDVSYRRDRLSRMRVFLVFDDVETISQLEHLLMGDLLNICNLFALGSRIIVTSRNLRVLENARANIYRVECLHSHESLQLFGIHAFRQYFPPDDWMHLSYRAMTYCKGSPLAIKVLGGALFCKDKTYWESFLCDLRKFPKPEILQVLRRSFDELGIVEKRVFLDIACLYPDLNKSFVITYFSTISSPRHVIEDLIDKSLFNCIFDKDDTKIEVHDLLREMAWSIVNEESKLENRTRLKSPDDILKLLTIRKGRTPKRFDYLNIMKAKEKHRSVVDGVRATEGIALNLSDSQMMCLGANAFEGMTSLKFLAFFYSRNKCSIHKKRNAYGDPVVQVPYGGLDTLPESLRWLYWEGFPSKSLPSRFSPENLVVLVIRDSPTMKRCWEGAQPKLVNLQSLNLSLCIKLVAVPDLSGSPNLEVLILRGCKSLRELPSHVQNLEKLVKLSLQDCTNLRSLPPRLNSKLLTHVYMSNCPKITRCPEIDSGELELLDLMTTPIEALPGAIYNVKDGGFLHLCGNHITSFPVISASLNWFRLCHTTIRGMDCYDDDEEREGSLPTFVRLEFVGSPRLTSLSRNVWTMVSSILVLEDCKSIESLPEIPRHVSSLTRLFIVCCGNLKCLPPGINYLKSLKHLRFIDTDIKSLPDAVQELDQLSNLELSFNNSLEFIPTSICELVNLSYLSLSNCSRIQYLPELPPNLLTLDVSHCKLLQALPRNLGRLRWKSLYYEDCPHLETNLPKETVHNFRDHAVSNLHPQGVLQYSASEIPEWFAYRNANGENDTCMMVQLPPPNRNLKRLIKGIAFGVVCSSDIGYHWISITCDGNVGTTVVASWSTPIFGLGGGNQSDNVYMWYDKNLLPGTQGEPESWYERDDGRAVSFKFTPKLNCGEDPEKLKGIKIKGVGISLLY